MLLHLLLLLLILELLLLLLLLIHLLELLHLGLWGALPLLGNPGRGLFEKNGL
jgi:hypothetical protein